MHSVSAKGLNLSEVNDSGTQTHTIHSFNAEIHAAVKHWWGVYAILLLCRGIRCFVSPFIYTQRSYNAEVHSSSIHC